MAESVEGSESSNPAGVSRRGAVRLGGGLGLAALGIAGSAGAAAAAAQPTATRTPTAAPSAPGRGRLPASRRFDLTEPEVFTEKRLHEDRVQQSFAFDQLKQRIYVAQLRNGTADEDGHLCITQLDYAGNRTGWMHLDGFGHGVSIAVHTELNPDNTPGKTYLWTETDASPGGWGTKLAHFEWADKATVPNDSGLLKKYAPIVGALEYTAAIDPVSERLIVRHHHEDGKYINVYGLSRANAGDFSRSNLLASFKQPVLVPPLTISDVFQGYTAYGQYLYCLTGEAYASTGGAINSEITTIDMNTGQVVGKPVLTKAGDWLVYREPEGMAVYREPNGQVRLCFGFASGADERSCNIFFKNALL